MEGQVSHRRDTLIFQVRRASMKSVVGVSGWVGWCVVNFQNCLNDQAHNCLIHFRGSSGAARGQLRRSWGATRWKTTSAGRRPLAENDLWLKMTFDGRQPLTEGNLWWKTTFNGRRPLTEDDLWQKMTFDGRWPLMEDNLWRKTTFGGRQHLMEDNLWLEELWN